MEIFQTFCFIDSQEYLKSITCSLGYVVGDGIGGTEVQVRQQTGETCVQACVKASIRDKRINGVTVYSNGKPGCWCEQLMTGVNSRYTQYKTCLFPPPPPGQ